PRDALDDEGSVNVRLHRMIRRRTSYGPMLPEGLLEDDGEDRGIIFVFAGAHLKRQFEFVKTQWLNDGIFIGAPAEKDPLVGPREGSSNFTIPQRPIRRRLQELPLGDGEVAGSRSEEHTSELQSRSDLVCRLLLEKKKKIISNPTTARARPNSVFAKSHFASNSGACEPDVGNSCCSMHDANSQAPQLPS